VDKLSSKLLNFQRSNVLLDRALQVTPIGSQTFSKSYRILPRGVSPFFVEKAHGCRFWDIDGNEFIDLVNSLGSVTLGFCDPIVDSAVQLQMKKGVTYSLAHSIEIEVAELIVDMVPSAEMVQFAKNGTDVTSAAVRLARHITKRDKIAICGYHGWQDWSISTTTRDFGIPDGVKSLSYTFSYNDLTALEQLLYTHKGEFAAVIMEPMTHQWPDDGFLKGVRDLTKRHGALLIFDEIVTGFRFSNGGAQELFGVTPDLTTLGKGMANGYPLSALTGRKEYMTAVDEIFFSSTFGGETLSLAASKVVLTRLKDQPILDYISNEGRRLAVAVQESIELYDLSNVFNLSGHPSWSIWSISDHANSSALETRTFLLQELMSQGIFVIGSHNITAAHSREDLQGVANIYSGILEKLSLALKHPGTVNSLLRCTPTAPLFKVRG